MRKLGLDIGDKRIGVAISDPRNCIAQSLMTILRKSPLVDLMAIRKIIQKYTVDEVVVGLPLSLDGSLGTQAKKVLSFVAILQQQLNVPVKVWDERLTTLVARKALISSGVRRIRRKQVIDKVAAALILQGYLDSQQ